MIVMFSSYYRNEIIYLFIYLFIDIGLHVMIVMFSSYYRNDILFFISFIYLFIFILSMYKHQQITHKLNKVKFVSSSAAFTRPKVGAKSF